MPTDGALLDLDADGAMALLGSDLSRVRLSVNADNRRAIGLLGAGSVLAVFSFIVLPITMVGEEGLYLNVLLLIYLLPLLTTVAFIAMLTLRRRLWIELDSQGLGFNHFQKHKVSWTDISEVVFLEQSPTYAVIVVRKNNGAVLRVPVRHGDGRQHPTAYQYGELLRLVEQWTERRTHEPEAVPAALRSIRSETT